MDEKVSSVEQPPGRVLDPRKHAVDAAVDLLRRLDGNGQKVVSEESFEDAQEGARNDIAEEVAPEDNPGGCRGDSPRGDNAPNQANQDGLRSGHKVRQDVDAVPELLLKKR